tara:strand:+ start:605 stop:2389 length:1785 start_codon:yes stop_codon:yes gene_type:complete
MLYAVFSDLHGNLPAWKAVLADMEEHGAETYICLGDIVGYGPKPQEVLDGVRSVTENIVLGNHDAAVCGRMDASIFNDKAREIVEWTRSVLSEEAIAFFSEVPLTMDDSAGTLFVHAEIEDPGRFGYITDPTEAQANLAATTARLTFIGHTHTPAVFATNHQSEVSTQPAQDFQMQSGCRYIVNVGSAGEPRDMDVRASYCLFDDQSGQIKFRRVEFDVEAYRSDVQAAGIEIEPFFLQAYDHLNAGESTPTTTVSPRARQAMTQRLNRPVKSEGRERTITLGTAILPSNSRPIQLPAQKAVGARSATPNSSTVALVWIASTLTALALVAAGLWTFTTRRNNSAISDITMAHTDVVLATQQIQERPIDGAPPKPPAGLVFHSHFDYSDKSKSLPPETGGPSGVPQQIPYRSAQGKFGKAMLSTSMEMGAKWDGAGDFGHTDSFTASVWIQRENSGFGSILGRTIWNATRGYQLRILNFKGKARVSFQLIGKKKGNHLIEVMSETSIPMSEWVHVAVTYDGSGAATGIQLYINGDASSQMVAGKKALSDGFSVKAPFRVGGVGKRTRFAGRIDEVTLYDRVLNTDEIRRLAGKGL